MIWWWFTKKYEIDLELNKKIQLTKGLSVKYSLEASGIASPKFQFEVWIEENHYVLSQHIPHSEDIGLHVLSITRNKGLISLKINGEKRSYYLKTPPIWKLK